LPSLPEVDIYDKIALYTCITMSCIMTVYSGWALGFAIVKSKFTWVKYMLLLSFL